MHLLKVSGRNRERMGSVSIFPYHYGKEAEAYTFYRIPKVLFTEPVFSGLSTDAKLLYGLLIDRMQISVRNGWLDSEGRVYIYYTIDAVMEAMSCGNKKAGTLLAELDDKKGIGLISRVRQGLGKPDRIYVRKCITPDMSEVHSQICQNDTSGDVESTAQDMSKGHTNKKEINKNNLNKIESNLISSEETHEEERNGEDEYQRYQDYFRRSLFIDDLKRNYPYDDKLIEEILSLLVDTCCSRRAYIRIASDDKPAAIVKSQLMKLEYEHIQFVLDCFKENTTRVRNIRQYLLAALYNAPITIDGYYTALVHHDMYGAD